MRARTGGGAFFFTPKTCPPPKPDFECKIEVRAGFVTSVFLTVSSALGPRHRGHPFCLLGGRRHDLLIAAGRTNCVRGIKRKICFTHKICALPRHDNSFLTRQPSTCYVMRYSIFGFACLGRAGPPLRRAWAATRKCRAWACAAPGPRLGLGRAWAATGKCPAWACAAPGPRLGLGRAWAWAAPGLRLTAWHCYAAAQRGPARQATSGPPRARRACILPI